jgi:hypothetical protein
MAIAALASLFSKRSMKSANCLSWFYPFGVPELDC